MYSCVDGEKVWEVISTVCIKNMTTDINSPQKESRTRPILAAGWDLLSHLKL